MKDQNTQATKHRGTGLAIHAATAAFTPARAATSHLRKRYRTHYAGRYRYARVVFGFDLSLLGLAVFLAALNIYLFTALPSPIGDLRLVFRAPAIHTAEPLALEGVVSSASSSTRENVRVKWTLQPGTEILEAEPPLNASGEAFLGNLKPGEQGDSKLVVRLFTPGDTARFDFTVSDSRGAVTGHETRQIQGSGLSFEPVLQGASLASNAPIAYRLKNTTSLVMPTVSVSALGATMDGSGRLDIGDLPAFGERIVFVLPDPQAPMRLGVSSKSVPLIDENGGPAILTSDPTGATLTLKPSGGHEARFTADASRAVSVLVYHPGLPAKDNQTRIYDLPIGHTDISMPVDTVTNTGGEWFAIPFVRLSDGNALGAPVRAPLTTAFELGLAARYYASTGDQLGVGPLPPQVGQSTKYWIQLSLKPTTSDVSDVRVLLSLGKNVRVTGRDALPDGGSFSESDGSLVWTAPFLAANSQGITASFEIELIPDASQKNSVPVLINSASATATDQRTNSLLESSSSGVDANLPQDEIGKNNGTVR